MALPIVSFAIKEVLPPRVGEQVPARVSAELVIDLDHVWTRADRGGIGRVVSAA
jgi:hypothetical protein